MGDYVMEYFIAREYTDAPGGRFIDDGPFSGEDFRENILKPMITKLSKNEKIHLVFDGAYGYATSFLEEAFGGLSRELGSDKTLNYFYLESNDEPEIVNRVIQYIKESEK
jgi:hypothetical protein